MDSVYTIACYVSMVIMSKEKVPHSLMYVFLVLSDLPCRLRLLRPSRVGCSDYRARLAVRSCRGVKEVQGNRSRHQLSLSSVHGMPRGSSDVRGPKRSKRLPPHVRYTVALVVVLFVSVWCVSRFRSEEGSKQALQAQQTYGVITLLR